jgi:hypothetical protein
MKVDWMEAMLVALLVDWMDLMTVDWMEAMLVALLVDWMD